MNKHRAYWSAMGLEPDETHQEGKTEKLKQEMQKLIDIYGKDKVITALRKICEEGGQR